jgi:hypothetical protein
LSFLSNASQNAGGQYHDRPNQSKYGADRDPDDPERQQQEPDDRVYQKRRQRYWPAGYQKYAPNEKLQHRICSCHELTQWAAWKFGHAIQDGSVLL